MHRFYMFHSFTKFHRNVSVVLYIIHFDLLILILSLLIIYYHLFHQNQAIAACALFLAAKVEEQPRKLEHVIKVAHWCLNIKPNKQQQHGVQLDVKSPVRFLIILIEF